MKKPEYKPYHGPAGPRQEQAENNTLALGEKLKEFNIPFQEDHNYAMDLWGSDDLHLKIEKGNATVYVGYDRWGFCAEGLPDTFLAIDQFDLEDTVEILKNWYYEKA